MIDYGGSDIILYGVVHNDRKSDDLVIDLLKEYQLKGKRAVLLVELGSAGVWNLQYLVQNKSEHVQSENYFLNN